MKQKYHLTRGEQIVTMMRKISEYSTKGPMIADINNLKTMVTGVRGEKLNIKRAVESKKARYKVRGYPS